MTKAEARNYWKNKWRRALGTGQHRDPETWYIAGYWNFLKGEPMSVGRFSDERDKMWAQGYLDAQGDWGLE